ncbi:MAG TPA: ABC transporter ATP-binding protein [Anaerolineales bacterium]|nr:ABC transporter ATP-binding protein [Anaerolineales bacterium]
MTTAAHTPAPEPSLISLRGISKSFPGVLANDRIDLDIRRAEIHALLGENGAGKSTLVKILYGFYRADSGRTLLNGAPVSIRSPYDARRNRIGMVFQEFTLIPAFTVAENIALFLQDLPFVLEGRQLDERIREISEKYNLSVDPGALVSQLSIGVQQKVEILKLLLSESQVLILDEPTRVLAPHEVEALYAILAGLRQDGYAILLITHKLKEVLECADRISVLRAGRLAGSLLRAQADEARLVDLMFSQELSSLPSARESHGPSAGPLALELRGMETHAAGGEVSLRSIDLEICPGEILGVAGVSGNGQKELGDVVLGMVRCSRGKKLVFGQDMTNCSVQRMRRSGVAFIPENPLVMASVPTLSVLENIVLTNTWRYSRHGGLKMDWVNIRKDTAGVLARIGFHLPVDLPAGSLSGGNLQRMVIVRELSHQPRLIIASYLTRGLDVQSTLAARQALLQACGAGAAILLISEDLDELFLLSHRIIVLYQGRIAGAFRPEETDRFTLGRLMTGSAVNAPGSDHATIR